MSNAEQLFGESSSSESSEESSSEEERQVQHPVRFFRREDKRI